MAIADGDKRFAEILVAQADGAEKASMGGSGVAQLDNVGSHEKSSWKEKEPLFHCKSRGRRRVGVLRRVEESLYSQRFSPRGEIGTRW